MRLVDLDPIWWGEAGSEGQGMSFKCPDCVGRENPLRIGIAFENPLSGPCAVLTHKLTQEHIESGIYDIPPGFFRWKRIGDTFEAMTLTPSVNAAAAGHWHGSITQGEIR